jgi:hypothetical protein
MKDLKHIPITTAIADLSKAYDHVPIPTLLTDEKGNQYRIARWSPDIDFGRERHVLVHARLLPVKPEED